MKIAYLANIRFPSERAHSAQIAHMCQSFTENGLEVDLIVSLRSKEGKAGIEERYGFKPNFNFFRIQHVMFSRKIKMVYYLSNIFFALNYLLRFRRYSHDVIFSRDEFLLFILLPFVSNKKIIWESHDIRLNIFARYLIKRNVFHVVTSRGLFDDYKDFGGNDSNLLLAHNSVDESFYAKLETKEEARKRLGIGLEQRVVMYIGGLDAWKGVEEFMEASRLCHEAAFVIIGGNESIIKDLSRKYPQVKFLGPRPYYELKDNQQAADVLVVPNTAKNEFSEKYTSPLKMFSYMTSGIPIVASNIASIRSIPGSELVSLSPPDSAEAMSAAIKDVLKNYGERKRKAHELRRFSKMYTWSHRAKKIIDFISTV